MRTFLYDFDFGRSGGLEAIDAVATLPPKGRYACRWFCLNWLLQLA